MGFSSWESSPCSCCAISMPKTRATAKISSTRSPNSLDEEKRRTTWTSLSRLQTPSTATRTIPDRRLLPQGRRRRSRRSSRPSRRRRASVVRSAPRRQPRCRARLERNRLLEGRVGGYPCTWHRTGKTSNSPSDAHVFREPCLSTSLLIFHIDD